MPTTLVWILVVSSVLAVLIKGASCAFERWHDARMRRLIRGAVFDGLAASWQRRHMRPHAERVTPILRVWPGDAEAQHARVAPAPRHVSRVGQA